MPESRPLSQSPGDASIPDPGHTESGPVTASQSVCSTELLNGRASVAIDHEGTRYVLRATRTGKLILTK